ncbi:hypothetical protein N7474_009080 [Penicillium riverlandense]|uniref:uncharacterized protein n=1 Tax=Penicillium riverlandense TaxID=1903569 RepID=UPI002548275C|nr:uncharacterized protein N7474_009080 [Penicillium riverlandense]KAJ5807811.1 hypothetical protein N7474_009080 [Penicillium riverlandense]
MSTFGPKSDSDRDSRKSNSATPSQTPPRWATPSPDTPSPPSDLSPVGASSRGDGSGSRPASMVFSRNPPLMQQDDSTPAELAPIFSYINTHTNKVYHEGYFLKLNDLDSHGRPCADRQWLECYAQLVGTVLSLWDAAALDAAGGEEVPPTFINLTDASIKMIETLPIRNGAVAPLKNVLSLCSAGQNRYLLHFNSFHSLTQWTGAIRLAMFEHTSLYEAYTGSLIAARGKNLPGINSILLPCRFKYEDWARVRFGAGTPWRRCWFVVTPPDEKELQKARKAMKKSAYDRLTMPITGNIKFYDSKKTKKVTPIATVTSVYSAYAIYPQSQALIEQSTLVKLEGRITTHGKNQTSAEGFVFVMPEVHPAVSGFEMMLRFLFATFDTFNLYGRPTRLVADTNHIKSIMFAFPKQRRYGYLDILDISNLLQAPGSQDWTEADWRKQLKEATQKRISTGRSRTNSVTSQRPRYRSSLPPVRNSDTPTGEFPGRPLGPSTGKPEFNKSTEAVISQVPRGGLVPPAYHNRGHSDTSFQAGPGLRPGYMVDNSPHSSSSAVELMGQERPTVATIAERTSSEGEGHLELPDAQQFSTARDLPTPPAPVSNPPAFSHGPGDVPSNRPRPSSEMRKANNRMSHATLSQLAQAGKMGIAGAAVDEGAVAWADQRSQSRPQSKDGQYPQEKGLESGYASQLTAPSNRSLAHSSSDEGINLAVPVQPPRVPEHREGTSTTASTPSPRPSPRGPQIDPTVPVKRKPLPQRQLFPQAPQSPGGEPSMEELRYTLDEDALNRVAPPLHSVQSPVSPEMDEEESVYDDESTTTPDYASTHDSVYSKKSTKSTRPRMGVMKTVGTGPTNQDFVIGDARYTREQAATSNPTSNPDIPTVDFGPTLTYMPTTGHPETTRKPVHQRKDSDGTEMYKLSVPTQPMDPTRAQSRSPNQDEYRRSMLWQPGMATGRPVTPGGGLTPEQYVQQRAAPAPPMHGHYRSPSKTPPLQRPASGDWTQQARPNSQMTSYRDANYRPSSRGANNMMNYNHNEMSSHLSAREQEHVARMTGSSFFNMSNDNRRPQPNTSGLVSAIDAREREKRALKEGMSNQMVQHAIAQRQQQMMQQQPPYQQQQSFQQQQSYPQQPYMGQPPQAGSMYGPRAPQESLYNLPTASRTMDNLLPMARPDEPRRRSWYGQLQPTGQAPNTPPSYQQSQTYASQHPGYYNNPHTMHS